jgi:hypothetical protein
VCQRLASFTKIARLSIVLKKYLYHVVPLQSSCPRKLPTIQLLPIITMARWHSTAPRLNSTVWCSNHQTPSPLPDSGLPNQFLSQGYLPLKKCVQICSNMFKYGTFMHLCLHIAEGSINAIQDSWWFMEGTTFLELKCSCLHERSHANRWIGLWQTSCKWFVGVFDIFWNPMGSDLNQIVKMIKSQGLPLSHVPYNP